MFSIVSKTNGQVQTMSSTQLVELLHFESKSSLNKAIKKMFQSKIDDSTVESSRDSRGYVEEYYLPELESKMFVAKHDINYLEEITQFWINGKNKQPQLPQTFAEALQLAADQAKQLELAAPKVAFVDKLVSKKNLMNVTSVAQKHGLSAIKLNKILLAHDVYSKSIKHGKVYRQWFIDKNYGEMKQTDSGFSQPMITNSGEVWINELLIAHGYI